MRGSKEKFADNEFERIEYTGEFLYLVFSKAEDIFSIQFFFNLVFLPFPHDSYTGVLIRP